MKIQFVKLQINSLINSLILFLLLSQRLKQGSQKLKLNLEFSLSRVTRTHALVLNEVHAPLDIIMWLTQHYLHLQC